MLIRSGRPDEQTPFQGCAAMGSAYCRMSVLSQCERDLCAKVGIWMLDAELTGKGNGSDDRIRR